jgi:hypothetical protein
MELVASCGMLEIPIAGMDERVVLVDLVPLPLRGRPGSDEVLVEGQDCFRKKSMVEKEREGEK